MNPFSEWNKAGMLRHIGIVFCLRLPARPLPRGRTFYFLLGLRVVKGVNRLLSFQSSLSSIHFSK